MAPSTAVSRWSALAALEKLRRRVRATSRAVRWNRSEPQVTRNSRVGGPTRISFSTFRSTRALNAVVSTTPRPLMMSCMGALSSWLAAGASPLPRRETPLVRGQDAELLAVLGDRAARDRETTLLERLRDFLVGLRLCRVFGGQDVLDHLLDRDRRHHLPVARRDAAVEEELQLEQPLRGFDVLVRRHPADRRLVHADVLADVAQRQRAEVRQSPVQELTLELDDRLRHLAQGP